MRNLVTASMATAVLLAGLLCGSSVAGPAWAGSQKDPSNSPMDPTCPGSVHGDDGWFWNASGNNEYGVRAPVETLFDGLLCTTSDAFAANWIGMEPTSANSIDQAGIIHTFRNGSAAWCRFWAIGEGVPNFYDCGDQSNGTYVYFQIIRYTNTMGNFYDIQDCGTGGGYGNCNVDNASQPAYSNPVGDVFAETNFACTIQLMGSSSETENAGTSSNPVEGLDEDWQSREWSYANADNNCSADYKHAQSSDVLSTWDSRN